MVSFLTNMHKEILTLHWLEGCQVWSYVDTGTCIYVWCTCVYVCRLPSEPGGSGSSGCAEMDMESALLVAGCAFALRGRCARNEPDLRHRAEDGDGARPTHRHHSPPPYHETRSTATARPPSSDRMSLVPPSPTRDSACST